MTFDELITVAKQAREMIFSNDPTAESKVAWVKGYALGCLKSNTLSIVGYAKVIECLPDYTQRDGWPM